MKDIPAKSGYWPIIILFLANVVYYVDRFVLIILIEPIKDEFQLSDSEVGILLGVAYSITYVIMIIPIGAATDALNRVKILSYSIMIWSAFTAAFGLVVAYWQMVMFRCGVAAAESGGVITTQSLVADYYRPEQRGLMLAILLIGAHVGKFFAFGIAGLSNDLLGWRATFFVVGFTGILMGPLLLLTLREPVRGESEGMRASDRRRKTNLAEGYRRLFRRPSYLIIVATISFASVAHYGILTWMPSFIIRKYELSTSDVGIMMSTYLIAPSILSAIIGGKLSDALIDNRPRYILYLISILFILGFASLYLALTVNSYYIAMSMIVVVGLVIGFYLAPLISLIHRIAGINLRGTAFAILMVGLMVIGQGIGPAVTGFMSDWFASDASASAADGLQSSLQLISGSFLMAAGVLLFAVRTLVADIVEAKRVDADVERV